jgi:hypothetical protein
MHRGIVGTFIVLVSNEGSSEAIELVPHAFTASAR